MTITITLSDEIEAKLQHKAEAEQQSVEDLALEILARALEAETVFPTPEEVVAKIKTMPPNPSSIRPPRAPLAEALRSAPLDSGFDLATWNREWAAIEAEIKAIPTRPMPNWLPNCRYRYVAVAGNLRRWMH